MAFAFGCLKATKPRIAILFLLTAGAALAMAGNVSVEKAVAVLSGIYLAVSGAGLLNNLFDSRLDRKMDRTRRRPTALGTIGGRPAMFVAASLVGAGLVVLWFWGGLWSAVLALAGVLYYAVLYTLVFKPRLALSTLPGSVAGVFPPLIAWAAAGGGWSLRVALLCGFILVWSPAHFWALALARKGDYLNAGIPTPIEKYGEKNTKLLIVASLLALVLLSLAPAFLGLGGPPYLIAVLLPAVPAWVLAGGLFYGDAATSAWMLHKLSGLYLAVLLAALALAGRGR